MSPTKPPRASGRFETAIAVLKQRFAERLQTGEAVRRQHASTLTWIPSEPPDAVIWVESTAEVADIVRVAAAHRVPIVPFGAGTSLEGHVNAPLGGLSLDFSRMDRVLAVNDRDLDCTVEAGISRRALNEHLRHHGLFFSVDPGAEEATIGGMAATRASGTTTVRYGTMRDNVLSLTAVMADGSLVRTARRARKSAAGYDLTRLLVGSEGTLGIITELTLRLHGVPEVILAAVCPFRTVEGACNTVIQAIQLGLGLARMELLDELSIRAANAYSHLTLEECPTLFLEFHGSKTAAREEIDQFRVLAMAEGAVRFDWAAHEEDRRRLWKARHDVYWAVRTAWPGKDLLATDVCVPISRLAECLAETQADIARSGLLAPIVGHVGDGNFHTIPVFAASDPADRGKVQGFLDRLAARALAMDGTATGEHGIGQGKIAYMTAEHGAGVEVMRRIKAALDPQGILNPGKILPPPA
ncbi:MAG TPA: FAD-linked oxidase C-terminal domain-containing protein [Hyphomicrobiaceae bacterium]|nr:FAD-linked oxidase C-terminal domain-containing protein [Hyphomicrobiaceae bacterium]